MSDEAKNGDALPPPGLIEKEPEHPIMMAEMAHHKGDFLKKEVVAYQVNIEFGGKLVMQGKVWQRTDGSAIRIEDQHGRTMLFDGDEVYLAPQDANQSGVRFGIFTWTYFFAFPFKLSDPGTEWGAFQTESLMEQEFIAGRLTFDSGTGDSPEDWYHTYFDSKSHLVKAAAYIVTYSKSEEEASVDPHAVVYENYKEVDGVPIAHTWGFYGWQEEQGLTENLGKAEISDVQFSAYQAEQFSAGSDFIKVQR